MTLIIKQAVWVAKGGPIVKEDKDIQDLNKTIEAISLKDYMRSESAAKSQREARRR